MALLPLVVLGQEEEPAPNPFAFVGNLQSGFSRTPLPVSAGAGGPLFLLQPIVETLGGNLWSGPLYESYRLEVGGTAVAFGSGSAMMTVGEELVALSQAPLGDETGLRVPLDALRLSYGELAAFEFDWDSEARTLRVGQQEARDIGVAVQVVHIQGVTTVVLEFDRRPRYTIKNEAGVVDVAITRDRLILRKRPRPDTRSLIREMEVGSQRVRLLLVEGAEAADPYQLTRSSRTARDDFRLVFDVSRQQAQIAAPRVSTRADDDTLRTIVLDPGHGGAEQGAIGPTGNEEKVLTLILAKALKRKLEESLPVRALLTRNEDADLPLDTRTALANQHEADLFLSIHLNSSPDPSAHGAETYFLATQASDAEAMALAEAENRSAKTTETAGAEADEFGLQLMLWDLAQSDHLAASQSLARLVQYELNEAMGLTNRGVRQAPFAVLMGATMPAVLLELAFISNPAEENQLQDPAYRSELLDAVVRAVTRFQAQRLSQSRSSSLGQGEE